MAMVENSVGKLFTISSGYRQGVFQEQIQENGGQGDVR